MKKKLLIPLIAISLVVLMGLTAFSLAGAAGPDSAGTFGQSGLQFAGEDGEEHPLEPYVQAAIAGILGMSVEEFQDAREEGERLEALIEAAGLTPEEFRAEMEAALPEIVEQALADGVIDDEQAAAILENGLPGPRRGFGPFNPYLLEATAEFLDMSVEDLQAALDSGTSISELLEEAGKTHLDLRMAIDAATPEIVDQALADGVIDEELAEKVLEYGFPPAGCRRHHAPGGPGGMGPGFDPGQDG